MFHIYRLLHRGGDAVNDGIVCFFLLFSLFDLGLKVQKYIKIYKKNLRYVIVKLVVSAGTVTKR